MSKPPVAGSSAKPQLRLAETKKQIHQEKLRQKVQNENSNPNILSNENNNNNNNTKERQSTPSTPPRKRHIEQLSFSQEIEELEGQKVEIDQQIKNLKKLRDGIHR